VGLTAIMFHKYLVGNDRIFSVRRGYLVMSFMNYGLIILVQIKISSVSKRAYWKIEIWPNNFARWVCDNARDKEECG
jgi:hypothetical protein